jgi:ABC-2 type transport system ATP-binding protein
VFTANAIEIIDLRKAFDSRQALVRSLMGRVVPDSGAMFLLGQQLHSNSDRAALGWVPQELALYSRLSARQNLTTFARYHGLANGALAQAVDRALEWAGLSDRANERVQTFSGGMKRRLNMAAGIIHQPRVLLLDEPTVGVDPQARERIYAMIEQLRAEHVSIIYTTHYMEEAERLCDRIAIIDHGRIIAGGTREELVRSHLAERHELIIRCAEEVPLVVRERLLARGASVDGISVRASLDDPVKQLPQWLDALQSAGVHVLDLTLKTPSLEDVFLHLTGRELRE